MVVSGKGNKSNKVLAKVSRLSATPKSKVDAKKPKTGQIAKQCVISKNVLTKAKAAVVTSTSSRCSSPASSIQSSTASSVISFDNMVTSTCGPRIHAQRKFAQPGNIYSGTLSSRATSQALSKRSKKELKTISVIKKVKPLFSPPPSKRPKTEDFLTFLCLRDTPALPPELSFLNYPQEYESSNSFPITKKKCLDAQNHDVKNAEDAETHDSDPKNGSTTYVRSNSANASKHPLSPRFKSTLQAKSCNEENDAQLSKKMSPTLCSVLSSANKAENPTKGIRATASSVLFSKLRKTSPTRPLLSPPMARLNEQDARFAMTALKLKYHRIVSHKHNTRSMILSKKAKEKSIILTRSKSRIDSSRQILTKKIQKACKPSTSTISPSRSAPSPDIILGVNSCYSAVRKSAPNFHSDSESDSSKSTESKISHSSDSDDVQQSTIQTNTRSLRSGKEIDLKSISVSREKVSEDKRKERDAPEQLRRVGTRSALRLSKSPLRELPLHKVKKIVKKPLKRPHSNSTVGKSQNTSNSSKTDRSGDGKRPSRKTKETAAIYLALVTKGFSTDEEDVKTKVPKPSESGSSSSEEKFLEKQYNASLKRSVDKGKSKSQPKSQQKTIKTRSKDRGLLDKTSANSKMSLRSGKIESISDTRSSRLGTPTVGDKKMPGAARKSASITCRRRSQHSKYPSCDDSTYSSSDECNAKVVSPRTRPRKRVRKTKLKCGSDRSDKSPDRGRSSSSESHPNEKLSQVKGRPQQRRPRHKFPSSTINRQRSRARSSSVESSMSESQPQVPEDLFGRGANIESRKSMPLKKIENIPLRSPESSPEAASSDEDTREKSEDKLDNESIKSESCLTSSSSDEELSVRDKVKVDMATQVDMDFEEGIPQSVSIPELEERENARKSPSSDSDIEEIGHVFANPAPSSLPSFQQPQYPSHSIINSSTTTFHHQQFHQQVDPYPPSPYASYTSLLAPPPLVHSSLQLVGSTAFPVATNPLTTLSIPVTVPHLSHLNILPPPPPPPPIGTYHTATTLQTHIRSVATNLDIPLVRPVVGQESLLNRPVINLPPNAPLTRPTQYWNQEARNPYSAFRVPSHQHQVIHQQTTTVLGVNSTPVLPVSIIQPQRGVSNVQPSSQEKVSQERTKGASTSSTSKQKNTPPGYDIIKHLPNVSIVPKFDRSNTSCEKKKQESLVTKEPKKVGRKPKAISAVLPEPTSPLTVRKDSNPATYVAKSSKKNVDIEEKDSNSNEAEGCQSQKLNISINATNNKQVPENEKAEKPKQEKVKQLDTAKSQNNELHKIDSRKKKTSLKSGRNAVGSAQAKDKLSKAGTNSRKLESTPSASSSLIQKNESKPKPDAKPALISFARKSVSSPTPSTSSTCSNKSKGGSGKSSKLSKNSSPKSENTSKPRLYVEAPTFYPTEKDFEEPLKYILQIQNQAEKFGMARIVPPKSFRPDCNVQDDMRFTAYNHYIHKMYQRWGPNVAETQAIKENLKGSQVDTSEVPMISGMEINLATLFQTVQSFGGLTEVIEKGKWTKVADFMHVPKAAHDRASKLDAIYVKYVLPYALLSEEEREKLRKKVEKRWFKRRDKLIKAANSNSGEVSEDSLDELDDCIVKGKSTPLGAYFRVSRNTSQAYAPPEKEFTVDNIEDEYWRIVKEGKEHVCVYSGSIDCAGVGWGFPVPAKGTSKHPWNLKVLANNQGSVLRSMGPVMGATVPTLHVAMLFTSYCWYRDPHSLPWVEYLHSGANKIWYSVASMHEDKLRTALKEMMPMQCKNKQIWLASDSVMVPPDSLSSRGVPLVRTVQNPGEFLVVFPKAFTSAVCTGYLISESVCFAYPSWLKTCLATYKDIKQSKEPPVFPIEKLLLSIMQDARAPLEVVRLALPSMKEILSEEIKLREKVIGLGVKHGGKISSSSTSKKKGKIEEEENEQCYTCNYSLYLSMVRNNSAETVYCLNHAIEYLQKHKASIKKSVILFDHPKKRLEDIVKDAEERCSIGSK